MSIRLRVSAEIFNKRQKRIRDTEWKPVEEIIAKYVPGKFMDVGCGTGYTMAKAQKLGFWVAGLEPDIGHEGVRDTSGFELISKIIRGVAGNLPFPGNSFDVVYSSHALEHFEDREKSLSEMKRVLHENGVAVLVMPTGTMALVNLISKYLFETHIRTGRFLLKTRSYTGFKEIFFPPPHGSYAKSIIGEIKDFSIRKWQQLLRKYFSIDKVILPALYPFPDYPPLFPMIRSRKLSSSVIFVCSHLRQMYYDAPDGVTLGGMIGDESPKTRARDTHATYPAEQPRFC